MKQDRSATMRLRCGIRLSTGIHSRRTGGGEPEGDLLEAINDAFGSFATAKEKLTYAAADEFGSGWAWLVHDGTDLEILSTTDAVNPVRAGKIPLLTIDVWEHAYYLDRQNERGKYIEAGLEHLLNWEFAAQNFQKASNLGTE